VIRVTLAFVVVGLTIAAVSAQTESSRPRDPAWTAPADASGRVNPLASRPQLSAGGKKLFGQRCRTCHGDDRRGTDRAPDLTSPAVQAQTDGALYWKISGGNSRAGMPSFSFLPEPQRWQLVLYLRDGAISADSSLHFRDTP